MEQLEILNNDGSGTGVYKDRKEVHRDGDLHASSHVWVVRDDTGSGYQCFCSSAVPTRMHFQTASIPPAQGMLPGGIHTRRPRCANSRKSWA